MTLCTPCQNFEDDYIGITYEPSLDEGETCGRCGDGWVDEMKTMDIYDWYVEIKDEAMTEAGGL